MITNNNILFPVLLRFIWMFYLRFYNLGLQSLIVCVTLLDWSANELLITLTNQQWQKSWHVPTYGSITSLNHSQWMSVVQAMTLQHTGNLCSAVCWHCKRLPEQILIVQGPGGFMSPSGGGKRHSVFWKVIGCPDHSRMTPFISGELFDLRVEKNKEI